MQLKRSLALILVLASALAILPSCAKNSDSRLKVVCTLFPQYDFARYIGGDKINLVFVLEPGQDYRDHKPDKAAIKKYADCDIFIFTNDIIEPWVSENLELLKSKGARLINACEGVAFDMNLAHDHHDHGEDHSHHEHGSEPHVWSNPLNAAIMAENVSRGLISADPENAHIYRAKAEELNKELLALDSLFSDIINKSRRKPLIMADRFTLQYFTLKYSLGYLAAIGSCAENKEPSEQSLSKIIDSVKKLKISHVFYREMSDKSIALKVKEETGAGLLLFHSCENLSQEEWQAGKDFLSLMKTNAENLELALS